MPDNTYHRKKCSLFIVGRMPALLCDGGHRVLRGSLNAHSLTATALRAAPMPACARLRGNLDLSFATR
jgi:hypothetical protein